MSTNNETIYNYILSRMDQKYHLVEIDHRDEIPPEVLHRCLKDGLTGLTQECYYLEGTLASAKSIREALMEDAAKVFTAEQLDEFYGSYEYEGIVNDILDRNCSDPDKDVFVQSDLHARVMLHSNYDCWVPPYDAGSLQYGETALVGLLDELNLNPALVKKEARRQGIRCSGRWHNLQAREGKEIVPYEGFVKCLRECPNYGLWTFFGLFDMQALYDANCKTKDLVIPKGTVCTMFNDWNGGGSYETTETIREISLRDLNWKASHHHDCARVYVDERFKEARGYSSNEVYGCHLSDERILTKPSYIV